MMPVRRSALIGLAALVAGCASAPTRFHTLDPVPPAAAPAARAVVTPVRIDSVTVPPELDRPQIVRRAGPGKLDLADADRWAGALDELARRALAADLQQRLPPGAVLGADDPMPPPGAHRIDVVIERFEGAVGGPVALDARWTLLADNPDRVLLRREAHVEAPASGDIDGTVTAMSVALGQLADRIAAEVR